MAMEFEVGSVADLISGQHTPELKHKTKIGKSPKRSVMKFKPVKAETKSEADMSYNEEEWHIESNQTSYNGEDSITRSNEKVKKRRKIKLENAGDSDENNVTEKLSHTSNAINAQKRVRHRKKKEMIDREDLKKCEVFVGNVPLNVTSKKLVHLFKKYGRVDSVRLRSAPVEDPRIPKKVAVIKKKFHPNRKSMNAIVRFTKPENAQNALEANGTVFEDHHLRVDLISKTADERDLSKAVFIGNLAFDAEDDELWKIFEACGPISSVRIVRDNNTGAGKGFGFVNFETADAVELAMQFDGTKFHKRELRVSRALRKPLKVKTKDKKPKILKKKKNPPNEGVNSTESKIEKTETDEEVQSSDTDKEKISNKIKGHKINKKLPKFKVKTVKEVFKTHDVGSDTMKSKSSFKVSFQGQKTAEDKLKKKKKKANKDELKKMSMIRKISSKSKPSMKKVKKSSLKIKSAAKKMKFKPMKK